MKKPLKLNLFINKTILTITKNLYQFFDHKITFVNTNLALYQKIQILCRELINLRQKDPTTTRIFNLN